MFSLCVLIAAAALLSTGGMRSFGESEATGTAETVASTDG